VSRKSTFVIFLGVYTILSIIGNYVSKIRQLPPVPFFIVSFVIIVYLIALFGLWRQKKWGGYLYAVAAVLETPKIDFSGFRYHVNLSILQAHLSFFDGLIINMLPPLLVVLLFALAMRNSENQKGATAIG